MPAPTNPYQPYAALHAHPNGAGDQRPTAMRVLFDEGLLENGLAGKVFLVTGCSAGVGVETARALYAAGQSLNLRKSITIIKIYILMQKIQAPTST